MPPVIATTEVDRAAAEVFAYATDPARFPEWQEGVTEGHLDHPGPPEAGARCLTTRRIGGASRTATSEVTQVDPPRTWGVRGIGKILVPLLVRRQAQKEMPANIAALKRRIEAQQPQPEP